MSSTVKGHCDTLEGVHWGVSRSPLDALHWMSPTDTRPMTDPSICTANGTLYRAPNRLALFDQINLAHCAAARAKVYVIDHDRFQGEYVTASCWTDKRVKIDW